MAPPARRWIEQRAGAGERQLDDHEHRSRRGRATDARWQRPGGGDGGQDDGGDAGRDHDRHDRARDDVVVAPRRRRAPGTSSTGHCGRDRHRRRASTRMRRRSRMRCDHPGPVRDERAGALVRADRRPPRRRLPPLLVHQGHRRRRSTSSSTPSASSPGQRVLDVGCGPGRHAHELARRGIAVHGIDISHRFVDLARQRRPAGRHLRAPRRPRASPSTPSSTPPSRCARAPSAW